MASIKHYFATFFVSVLLTSAVQGQSDLNFESCTYNNTANGIATDNTVSTEKGNKLRTYEILCGKPANLAAFDNSGFTTTTITNNGPVTQNTATFTTLCGYINGPSGVAIKDYIGTNDNPHTIFAPTDAAFNAIGGETFDSDMIMTILQLHILGDTYLTSDLECDRVYNTLNLEGLPSPSSDRQSITKCRGTAGTIEQLGGGNSKTKLFPTIGDPINVFSLSGDFLASGTIAGATQGFTSTVASSDASTLESSFSSNVIGCNGVIHVVNEVLIPPFSDSGSKSGSKSSKSEKRRELVYDGNGVTNNDNNNINNGDYEAAKQDREVSRENRRRRLEALLEPNGNIKLLN